MLYFRKIENNHAVWIKFKFEKKVFKISTRYVNILIDVKNMESITVGDIVNLLDQVQTDYKKIEVSFKFVE